MLGPSFYSSGRPAISLAGEKRAWIVFLGIDGFSRSPSSPCDERRKQSCADLGSGSVANDAGVGKLISCGENRTFRTQCPIMERRLQKMRCTCGPSNTAESGQAAVGDKRCRDSGIP